MLYLIVVILYKLLILFLFSSSQTEKPLILVHIEFNILAVEFIIVGMLYFIIVGI